MEAIWNWGIDLIRLLQRLETPWLTFIMKAISFFGTELSFLVLLPLVFWCIDEKRGFRLGLAVILSSFINLSLKSLFGHPRPYDLDPSVGRGLEDTYGLPSHHAQSAVTFWGIVGCWLKGLRAWLLGLGLPLLISLSRVYLGVHFPTDIFAGWLLGAAVLLVFFTFGDWLANLLSTTTVRFRLISAAVVAIVMNAINPQQSGLSGLVFGMGAGYVLMTERWPITAALAADGQPASWFNLLLRYLLGMVVTGALYFGLKQLLPTEGSAWYGLFRFLRYGLLGFWVSAGAPWIFRRLKMIGEPESHQ